MLIYVTVIYFVCDVTRCDVIEIIFVSFSAYNMLPTEGLPQSAKGQYSQGGNPWPIFSGIAIFGLRIQWKWSQVLKPFSFP